MNDVFNLHGPEFLKLYISLLAGAIVLLIVFRLLLRGPHDSPAAGLPKLGALEAAYLSRGRRGTVDAAIAALAQRGAIQVKSDVPQARLRSLNPPRIAELTDVEAAVYDAVARQFHGDAS